MKTILGTALATLLCLMLAEYAGRDEAPTAPTAAPSAHAASAALAKQQKAAGTAPQWLVGVRTPEGRVAYGATASKSGRLAESRVLAELPKGEPRILADVPAGVPGLIPGAVQR